ncbi:hypothetical protein RhiirC2_723397 [Rhizophagus irregularis]|uniref:Uncharacterized protein n=1 Tax=Rhizophagus irregularis TaxID=588596 RepID=A0A2N1P3X3_9GLOM|nr:hypothetical protein RhiirC2_723397 [Rhizophagus irregularis]
MTNRKLTEYAEDEGRRKPTYRYIHATKEEQEIRERKNIPRQESTDQTSSSSNNNDSNIINNLIYYLNLIRDKCPQLSRKTKIGVTITVLTMLLYYFLIPEQPPSAFIRDFVDTTTTTFEEINSVDLPASSMLTQHTVTSRNAANMVQNSPAFKDHGNQIATGLRNFGEKITLAGRHLQNMYNKGSTVYKTFDTDIEAMINRLKQTPKKGDAKYFRNKLSKFENKIKDFRQHVEMTQSSIVNAEETRHDTEGYIIDGLREAEKYISNNNEDSQKTAELSRAKKELQFITDLLGHLDSTAVHLDKIRKILSSYEDKLLNVEAELGTFGKDEEEGIFEVNKEDIKHLKIAVETLKASHLKFNHLSN